MRVPGSPPPTGHAIARFVIDRRAWIACAWVVLAGLLLPSAAGLSSRLNASARMPGSQSDSVAIILSEQFDSPFARSAVLVLTGLPHPRSAEGDSALRAVLDAVEAVPIVKRTLSFRDRQDSTFLGSGGESFVLVGLADGPADQLVPQLRASTVVAATLLRARYETATLEWTGEDAINHDLRRASAADVSSAERRALPLTIGLLLLAFGTVVAAALPIALAVLAIAFALGAAALLTPFFPLTVVLQNVVSMLGFGLGVDYSLLVVSRFREALRAGCTTHAAAVEASANAGHSIVVSAGAVLVGFAMLLLVPLADIRSIAIGGLVVVTTSALLVTTLLPGVLSLLGHRIDAGRLHSRRPHARAPQRWRRWAVFVARHPWRMIAIAGLPLVVLAAQTARLTSTLPRGEWLPRDVEASRGLKTLQLMRRENVVQGIRVVISFPSGMSALDSAGWTATRRLATTLATDPRIEQVRSLPVLADGAMPNTMLFYLIPDFIRRTFISRDGHLALVDVTPAHGLDGASLPALARSIRAMDAGTASGLPGVRMMIGGVPALTADYADTLASRTPVVVVLVLAGIFAALAIGFRSVIVPLKAVALNALVVAAALGMVVLVFQDGIGVRLIGLSGPLDGTFAAVPLLVFCVVFGLSIDYEVFLISRIAEARARGASEASALVTGVARSGRVITSAAAIMVAVFGAFALGDFVLVKILGVALSAAVILDATLVRLVVAPALLAIGGRYNWWPGSLATVTSVAPLSVRPPTIHREIPRRA